MNIKDTLWKLQQVGECSILDAATKEAAKTAAETINFIFLQFDISSTVELSELQKRVYELADADRKRAMHKLSNPTPEPQVEKGVYHVYHFGNPNAAYHSAFCTKGKASECDPDAFEWYGSDGVVLGVAKADGTPNMFDSYVTEVIK